MKKLNKKKGFTIVELVIVIGVIGILSAILIPTFVNVTANANIAALKSNLANAYSAYAADAADRVVDETKAELEFVAQDKVWLCATSNPGENDKGYTFTSAKGWDTEGTAKGTKTYTLVSQTKYNGYFVFVEGTGS